MGMQDRDWYKDLKRERDGKTSAPRSPGGGTDYRKASNFKMPPFQKPKVGIWGAWWFMALCWVLLLGFLFVIFGHFRH